MALSPTPPLLDAIARSMHQLDQRQRVVAENIANSETPHYKARDVAPADFSALLASQQQARGRAAHVHRPLVAISDAMVALGASRPRDPRVIDDKDTSETKPDGNNVGLEDQLLKMGQIQTDFSALTNLYRKQMGLIESALGRSG
ncbi:flagellar basal body rod protein FlgB [Sphingomonas sp. AP4-R1]|uniref:flagellar basal body rod protein FlgB n=1 Tax=Sphingomonas sp. AP4-R1 TaxID=2735134 RepID=UPI001493AAD6|nr:flagellar basal body rod protein FlgB [Sphingomonas sp. AP4-R1]